MRLLRCARAWMPLSIVGTPIIMGGPLYYRETFASGRSELTWRPMHEFEREYTIERELGSGGYGEVFLAIHSKTGAFLHQCTGCCIHCLQVLDVL